MAPTYVVAYNPTSSPVVVDSLGRTIGGGEWAAARRGQPLDDAGNRATVIVVTKIDDEANPDALRAQSQAASWTAAAEEWADAPLDQVRDVAKHNAAAGVLELPAEVDDVDRVDLVDVLVRAGVDPPPKSAAAKRAQPPKES
jgi:hypothetical protein